MSELRNNEAFVDRATETGLAKLGSIDPRLEQLVESPDGGPVELGPGAPAVEGHQVDLVPDRLPIVAERDQPHLDATRHTRPHSAGDAG